MKILAADTSTATGSVALLDGDQLVAEWLLHSTKTHNRRVLITVDMVLKEAGWDIDDLNAFAATTGPGSFTGIRIGLTTMKSLAWASGKPFVGIPSLDALAAPLVQASHPVCAMIDARKREVYYGLFQPDGKRCHLQETYSVAPPERVVDRIREPTLFCGDGWLLYRDLLREPLGDRIALELPAPYHSIRASVVGSLALERLREGRTDDPLTAVPVYVRPSEAELKYPHLSGSLRS